MPDTIYVVDDNEINLKMAAAVLQPAGYTVVTAQSAAQALSDIGTVRPVLAILDVMMPDVDGYELCRQLRARSDTARLPIIILTTLTEIDERLKAFEAGADDFIAKPFNPQELLARVKVLLRRFTQQESPQVSLQAETTAVFSLRGGVGVSTYRLIWRLDFPKSGLRLSALWIWQCSTAKVPLCSIFPCETVGATWPPPA